MSCTWKEPCGLQLNQDPAPPIAMPEHFQVHLSLNRLFLGSCANPTLTQAVCSVAGLCTLMVQTRRMEKCDNQPINDSSRKFEPGVCSSCLVASLQDLFL